MNDVSMYRTRLESGNRTRCESGVRTEPWNISKLKGDKKKEQGKLKSCNQ